MNEINDNLIAVTLIEKTRNIILSDSKLAPKFMHFKQKHSLDNFLSGIILIMIHYLSYRLASKIYCKLLFIIKWFLY